MEIIITIVVSFMVIYLISGIAYFISNSKEERIVNELWAFYTNIIIYMTQDKYLSSIKGTDEEEQEREKLIQYLNAFENACIIYLENPKKRKNFIELYCVIIADFFEDEAYREKVGEEFGQYEYLREVYEIIKSEGTNEQKKGI